MKKKITRITAVVMALALSATMFLGQNMNALAASKTTTKSTKTVAVESRIKALPQVKANGGMLPTSVYDYDVYKQYPDLQAAFGNNKNAYYKHYLQYGIKEGRTASASFNVLDYKNAYADLQNAFGEDLVAYIGHYLQYGIKEGRVAIGGIPQTVQSSASTVTASAPIVNAGTTSQTNQSNNQTTTITPSQNSTVKEGWLDDVAYNVMDEINQLRKEIGLNPLVCDDTLYELAKIRAKEAAEFFSHDRPDGTSCFTVFNGQSDEYTGKKGENICWTFTHGVIVTTWYGSDGHRANMLDEAYYYGAVATYYKDGVYYSANLFSGSKTHYTYGGGYELESWPTSDGGVMTAREADKIFWEITQYYQEYNSKQTHTEEEVKKCREMSDRHQAIMNDYLAAVEK